MKNSMAILATFALSAVLAIGSATVSMARGAGNGGHGRVFSSDHGFNAASTGDHGYATTVPFVANNGGGFSSGHDFSSRHVFDGGRHTGGFPRA
jgi:hypothetical protein